LGFFHIAIIALLMSLLQGCGYKTPPVYVPDKETKVTVPPQNQNSELKK
jgi:predicted small lipoprotein YifL